MDLPMENNKHVFFALGLGQKAGKVLSGDFAVTEALKKRKVRLLLVATDAKERTKEKLVYLCSENNVRMMEMATKQELGQALGKADRNAVAIVDENFVKMILK